MTCLWVIHIEHSELSITPRLTDRCGVLIVPPSQKFRVAFVRIRQITAHAHNATLLLCKRARQTARYVLSYFGRFTESLRAGFYGHFNCLTKSLR